MRRVRTKADYKDSLLKNAFSLTNNLEFPHLPWIDLMSHNARKQNFTKLV